MKRGIKALIIGCIVVVIIGAILVLVGKTQTYEADKTANKILLELRENDNKYDLDEFEFNYSLLNSGKWIAVAPQGDIARVSEGGEDEGTASAGDIGVIIYPGAKVEYKSYIQLAKGLADQGFVCVIPSMPFNIALLANDRADNIMRAYPGVDMWIIGGHSLGGVAAANYVEDNSDNIIGMFFLASYPNADLSDLDIPTVSIYGDNDGVMNMRAYEKNKTKLPADTTEKVIKGGNHAQFGNYGKQEGDGKATISAAKQQSLTVKYITEFAQ